MSERVDAGKDPWWFPQPGFTVKPRDEFFREADRLVPVMNSGPVGKIVGKQTLGPDTYTTMQTNRWKREQAS